MIKPEDVPQYLVQQIERAVKHDNGVLFGIFGTETEAKLNSCGDDVVEHWSGYGY